MINMFLKLLYSYRKNKINNSNGDSSCNFFYYKNDK